MQFSLRYYTTLAELFAIPLMTGVNTAIPAKFGSETVLSRIKPPMLGNGVRMRAYHSKMSGGNEESQLIKETYESAF